LRLVQVVNVAVVAFLMSGSTDFRAKAMLYSLADGPLAAALIAWQCSWVFSSPSHSISVLLHLLPGLALFVCRYVDAPLGAGAVVRHILSLLPSRAPPAGCGASLSLKVRHFPASSDCPSSPRTRLVAAPGCPVTHTGWSRVRCAASAEHPFQEC